MKVYEFKDIDNFFNDLKVDMGIKKNGKNFYYNIPMAFDIETTSFYELNGVVYTNEEIEKTDKKDSASKRAIMYIWQFAICDDVIYGRNWYEFIELNKRLFKYFDLSEFKRIVIYVHNLSFEFQFMCKYFHWIDLLADDLRSVIKATNEFFIDYRCSYRLSGYSLGKLSTMLKDKTFVKKNGDLDYSKLRNSKTILTKEELDYCFYDVLTVTSYIKEQSDRFGHIGKIPLTQTGIVRRYVRKECNKYTSYKYFIKKLTLENVEYNMLKNAFSGGFTHCNAMYADIKLKDVSSYDLTSSYPTVLLSEKFPMSKGRKIIIKDLEHFKSLCDNNCVLTDVTINNLRNSFYYDGIISLSKCCKIENPLTNNGRVMKCDSLTICVTDVELINICKFYVFDSITFNFSYVYEKGYISKPIVDSILKFYNDKSSLKGVAGKEEEYLHSKEMLNSIYGMTVTNIVRDNYIFSDVDGWKIAKSNLSEEIEKYNNDSKRFLFYAWGVWVTSYARNNLYGAILECQSDYVYCDTDSIKLLHADSHKEYFESYNKNIVEKLCKTMQYFEYDSEKIKPKDNNGIEKILGVWDFEGKYDLFKTLGAKRYMYQIGGDFYITVAGLGKLNGKEYLKKFKNPFDYFTDGLEIPADATGKLTHTYCDSMIKGKLVDFNGVESNYKELSFIHLENCSFNLSVALAYLQFYKDMQKKIKIGKNVFNGSY